MNALAEFAWTQIWQTTLAALGVGLIVRLCCRRRPHLAYLLWIVVILKCVTPPIWSSPTGIFSWTTAASAATDSSRGFAAVGPLETRASHQTTWSTSPLPSIQQRSVESALGSGPLSPQRIVTQVLLMIWLVGAMTCAGLLLFNMARVSKLLRQSTLPLDPAWRTKLRECARRLGMQTPLRLLVTSQPVGPAVYGFLRPMIVLPEAVVTHQPPIMWDSILSHELIHIRRRDPLAALLQCAARCLWWFHPLVWWVNRQADCERERACDEAVLLELAIDPAEYAQCLLDVLKLKQRLRPISAFPGVRAVEVTAHRLEHIMQPEVQFRSRTPLRHWVAALAAALLVLPGARGAFDSVIAAGEPQKSTADSPQERDAQDTDKEPNFVVIPIRTDLQRKLLNVDESVVAVIELNGYGLAGKRDGELLQAIDIHKAALQTAISVLPRRDHKGSVAIRVMYFGPVTPEKNATHPEDFKAIHEACQAIASKANLAFGPSSHYYSVEEHGWRRLVAARKAIDLTQQTADEFAEREAEVMAYPVRTKITRLLTSGFNSDNVFADAPDCIVYVLKPLDANDDPMIGAELRQRIESAVSKLKVADKNRISFHFSTTGNDPESHQRNRDAALNRVVGNDGESGRLAKSLGFKESTVSY